MGGCVQTTVVRYLALERHLPRPRAEYERALDELNDALEHALEELGGAGTVPQPKAV